MLHKTLNIKGTLTSLDTPLVMGILNVTPDSFYADSRKQTEAAIEERIQAILSEGGKGRTGRDQRNRESISKCSRPSSQ